MRLTEEEIIAIVSDSRMRHLGIWNGPGKLDDAALAGFRRIESAVLRKWADLLETDWDYSGMGGDETAASIRKKMRSAAEGKP